jgi:hypothetical protein
MTLRVLAHNLTRVMTIVAVKRLIAALRLKTLRAGVGGQLAFVLPGYGLAIVYRRHTQSAGRAQRGR